MRQLAYVVATVATVASCGRGGPRPVSPEARLGDPGSALIASEGDVWMLEGLLVAEADEALQSPEARAALGDPQALARRNGAENDVRAFLRGRRSERVRELADRFVAAVDAPTRGILDEVTRKSGISAADVLMDYLTYEGLYDLAIMRLGYKRWKAGRFEGAAEAQALAESFFADAADIPTARRGIRIVVLDERRIEIDVFGGRVREEIRSARIDQTVALGKLGRVTWASNYELLRRMSRGEERRETYDETLSVGAGGFRVSYAVELDEYLTWGATSPWATMLYALPADEVADLYAGVAAAGGLEAGGSRGGDDPEKLPARGKLGAGLEVAVAQARFVPSLAGMPSRRGQFALVIVEVQSSLEEPVRAPSDWFTLATARGEYPEVGVSRPGMAALLLTMAPKGARTLALPFTSIGPGASTLILVYDVPRDVEVAALVLGSDELALRVSSRPAEPPAATLEARVATSELRAVAKGKVARVVAAGTRVRRGEAVVELDGVAAVERDLARALKRLAHYQAKRADKKVQEKTQLVAALRRRLASLRIDADVDGEASPLVKRGARVVAGDVVASLRSRRLVATFVVTDAARFSAGSACRLGRKAAPGQQLACVVARSDGNSVEVAVVESSGASAGEGVVLAGGNP